MQYADATSTTQGVKNLRMFGVWRMTGLQLAPAITALAELSASEGLEHKFEVEEMDDETYSGMLIYKPWGDYTELPMMTC